MRNRKKFRRKFVMKEGS